MSSQIIRNYSAQRFVVNYNFLRAKVCQETFQYVLKRNNKYRSKLPVTKKLLEDVVIRNETLAGVNTYYPKNRQY